jgi:hypothetical protein
MAADAFDHEPQFTMGAGPSELPAEAPPKTAESGARPSIAKWVVLATIIGVAACYLLWPWDATVTKPEAPATYASSSPSAASTQPAIRHPVENIPSPAAAETSDARFPLPGLDESDVVARDAIETILNGDAFTRLLVPAGIVRHIVATVDNLPRNTIATGILPIVPVPGLLATASGAGAFSIGGENANRYTAYVNAAEAIDTKRLAPFYFRLYPLFQQAYVDLGYPAGYFNDRLVDVIDHLLAAPEPKPPVHLTQPKVLYEFFDPTLAELSAGQKILVRVGLENELRLKAKLREIRKAVTAGAVNR